MNRTAHPTRQALISTVVELLQTKNPENLKVDEVLSHSGISSGSLYHHFRDLPDLIDHAMVARYADDVDASIDVLEQIVANATDRESLSAQIRALTVATTSPERHLQRFVRAQAMTRATTHDRFRSALAPEQERLTNAIANLVRILQSKGFFDSSVDPVAASMFIQAYSLGFVINDVSGHPVSPDAVIAMVMRFHEKVLFAN